MSDRSKASGPPPIPKRQVSGVEVLIDTLTEENRQHALAVQATIARWEQRLRRIQAVYLPSACVAVTCGLCAILDDTFYSSFHAYLMVNSVFVVVGAAVWSVACIIQMCTIRRIRAESAMRERHVELMTFGTMFRRANHIPYADA